MWCDKTTGDHIFLSGSMWYGSLQVKHLNASVLSRAREHQGSMPCVLKRFSCSTRHHCTSFCADQSTYPTPQQATTELHLFLSHALLAQGGGKEKRDSGIPSCLCQGGMNFRQVLQTAAVFHALEKPPSPVNIVVIIMSPYSSRHKTTGDHMSLCSSMQCREVYR